MKKIILLIVLISSFAVFSNAQSTQLDFSVQYKNTNQHSIIIYPNPINQPIFNVKSNSLITKISIINMVGKIIFFKQYSSYAYNDITVRFPQCNRGVYLIKITFDDNETIIKKLFYQ